METITCTCEADLPDEPTALSIKCPEHGPELAAYNGIEYVAVSA
jgi:hypothetical protein